MPRVVTWLKSSVSNVGQTLTMRQPFVSHKPHQELLPGISRHFNRKHLGIKKIFTLTLMVSNNILFSNNYWHQRLIWAFGNVPNKVSFQPFRYFWLFAVPQAIAPFASHKSNQTLPLSFLSKAWLEIRGRALFNEVLNLWFFVTSPTCPWTEF